MAELTDTDRQGIVTSHTIVGGDQPPLIIAGLSRSGSSLLAHVASSLPDWYVFDDLDPQHKARESGASGPAPADAAVARFVDRLAVVTKVRVLLRSPFSPPGMSAEEILAMEHAVVETFRPLPAEASTWGAVTREWLSRISALHGGTRWGYQSGQHHIELDALRRRFPGARFACNQRDLRAVLRSYKNVKTGKDGDPRRYHPVVYSLYWRRAARTLATFADRHPDEVLMVPFERLIAEPDAVAADLARLVGATPPDHVELPPPNSSIHGTVRELTPTEVWLCERIAGPELIAAGYELTDTRPRLRDMPHLGAVSLRFLAFQGRTVVTSPARRHRILAAARGLIGRRT